MTISLSIDAILAQIYARAALRYSMNRPDSTVLTTDSRAALRALTIDAAAHVSLALLPIIEDTDIDADLLLFEIRESSDVNLPALRMLAEHAIAARVLAEIYASTDSEAAQQYSDEATRLLARLRLAASTPPRPRIKPFP